MRKNRDKLLGVAALITFIVGSLNTLEYFFATKKYLNRYEGVVTKADYKTYSGRKGVLYGRNDIELAGVKRKLYLTDMVLDGAFIDIKAGDSVVIWAKRWFQMLYSPSFTTNIYYVEKQGTEVYDNLSEWKETSFWYMCVFGGMALFLSVIYLDVVKGISLENWFQKKVLKNPAYLNKKRNEEEL